MSFRKNQPPTQLQPIPTLSSPSSIVEGQQNQTSSLGVVETGTPPKYTPFNSLNSKNFTSAGSSRVHNVPKRILMLGSASSGKTSYFLRVALDQIVQLNSNVSLNSPFTSSPTPSFSSASTISSSPHSTTTTTTTATTTSESVEKSESGVEEISTQNPLILVGSSLPLGTEIKIQGGGGRGAEDEMTEDGATRRLVPPPRFALRKMDPDEIISAFEDAIAKFNSSAGAEACFKKLISMGLILDDPESKAKFLFSVQCLDKAEIGRFLGAVDSVLVLNRYTELFSPLFRHMSFDAAMLFFFSLFRLPPEGQQVVRIAQSFSETYSKSQNNELSNPDTTYLLACSLLMLNTDLHSQKVKVKMTKSQFYKIFKETQLTSAFLGGLYDSIKRNEITVAGAEIEEEKKEEVVDIAEIKKQLPPIVLTSTSSASYSSTSSKKKNIYDLNYFDANASSELIAAKPSGISPQTKIMLTSTSSGDYNPKQPQQPQSQQSQGTNSSETATGSNSSQNNTDDTASSLDSPTSPSRTPPRSSSLPAIASLASAPVSASAPASPAKLSGGGFSPAIVLVDSNSPRLSRSANSSFELPAGIVQSSQAAAATAAGGIVLTSTSSATDSPMRDQNSSINSTNSSIIDAITSPEIAKIREIHSEQNSPALPNKSDLHHHHHQIPSRSSTTKATSSESAETKTSSTMNEAGHFSTTASITAATSCMNRPHRVSLLCRRKMIFREEIWSLHFRDAPHFSLDPHTHELDSELSHADGFLCFYNVTDRQSFEHVKAVRTRIFQMFRKSRRASIPFISNRRKILSQRYRRDVLNLAVAAAQQNQQNQQQQQQPKREARKFRNLEMAASAPVSEADFDEESRNTEEDIEDEEEEGSSSNNNNNQNNQNNINQSTEQQVDEEEEEDVEGEEEDEADLSTAADDETIMTNSMMTNHTIKPPSQKANSNAAIITNSTHSNDNNNNNNNATNSNDEILVDHIPIVLIGITMDEDDDEEEDNEDDENELNKKHNDDDETAENERKQQKQPKKQRVVSFEEGQKLAEEWGGVTFFETSAWKGIPKVHSTTGKTSLVTASSSATASSTTTTIGNSNIQNPLVALLEKMLLF